MKVVKLFSIPICVVVINLGACSQKPEPLSQIQAEPVQLPAVKKTLKPGAPVTLISPEIIEMQANQTASVDLHLQVLQKGSLLIKLSTSDDGLQLLATPAVQTLEVSTADIVLPIQLNAVADGRYYVNVNTLLETADGTTTRSLAVVVQVGNISMKALKPSAQTRQSDSDAVVSLPAQETIKP